MECALSLGSCQGDSQGLLLKAIDELNKLPKTSVVAKASFYETEAVDVPEKYKDIIFINTAVIVETKLSPDELSIAVHELEYKLGRIRNGERHAPRTIDIDIITHGNTISKREDLMLPHPEATNRRFVMEPIAEIRPNLIIPGQSKTAKEIVQALPASPRVKRIETPKLTPAN